MVEPWIDGVARAMACPSSRRAVLRSLVGAALGTAAHLNPLSRRAGAQSECGRYGQEKLCPSKAIRGDDLICVDTSTDSENCGQCGTVCPGDSLCSNSECVCSEFGSLFPAQLCPGGLVGGDLLCVDTSSDPDNCGNCGVVCSSGAICQQGVCSDGAGVPSNDRRVPFGVETVTTSSLTMERFEASLPRRFASLVVMSDVGEGDTTAPFYDGFSPSRSVFYRYSSEGDDTLVSAVANVSQLSTGTSMNDFIRDLVTSCNAYEGCVVDQENSTTNGRVLYALEHYPFGSEGEEIHTLVWGQGDWRLVYTFVTLSAASLEELAVGFVQNVSEQSEIESSGSPTP